MALFSKPEGIPIKRRPGGQHVRADPMMLIQRSDTVKHDALFRTLWMCAVLLLSSPLHADEKCGVEVKLLLSPGQTQNTVASFQLVRETTGQVYFFDTEALDLLSKGVIVQLRQGADSDLIIKVRPPASKKLVDPSSGREDFKCEMDLIGGQTNAAYSISNKYSGLQMPNAGPDIFSLLSDGQKKLLKEAGGSIDWTRVRRIASIKSTDWDTVSQPPFGRLTLELWEWTAGSILELSTSVGPNSGQPSYADLVRLVNAKELSISASQDAKTRMVLESFAGHVTH
jgi:hypothetical protein